MQILSFVFFLLILRLACWAQVGSAELNQFIVPKSDNTVSSMFKHNEPPRNTRYMMRLVSVLYDGVLRNRKISTTTSRLLQATTLYLAGVHLYSQGKGYQDYITTLCNLMMKSVLLFSYICILIFQTQFSATRQAQVYAKNSHNAQKSMSSKIIPFTSLKFNFMAS